MKYRVMRIKNGVSEQLSCYEKKEEAEKKVKFLKSLVREASLGVNQFYVEEVGS